MNQNIPCISKHCVCSHVFISKVDRYELQIGNEEKESKKPSLNFLVELIRRRAKYIFLYSSFKQNYPLILSEDILSGNAIYFSIPFVIFLLKNS